MFNRLRNSVSILPAEPDESAPGSAHELFADVRAQAQRIETDGQLPEDLVERLAAAGFFRLAVPRSVGGLEADPVTICEVVEELSRADGSTGWCVMIAAVTGVVMGRLDEAVAARLVADPRFLIAGASAPMGRAVPVAGGHRVTGRWPFASASLHASWLVGGCTIVDGGAPVLDANGLPVVRHVVVPAAEVTIHRTWRVAGLQGTGSHDIAVDDIFVPAAQSFSLAEPARHPGLLYAFPVHGLLSMGVAAAALGIGRAAVEELVRLAPAKATPGPAGVAAAKPSVQTAVAQAEATLSGGREFLFAAVREVWRTVVDGGAVTLAQRARLRLAIAHAADCAARAVDLVYRAGGASSVYATSPLQRYFRDIHVATQHAMVGADITTLAGAVMLGQPADTSRL